MRKATLPGWHGRRIWTPASSGWTRPRTYSEWLPDYHNKTHCWGKLRGLLPSQLYEVLPGTRKTDRMKRSPQTIRHFQRNASEENSPYKCMIFFCVLSFANFNNWPNLLWGDDRLALPRLPQRTNSLKWIHVKDNTSSVSDKRTSKIFCLTPHDIPARVGLWQLSKHDRQERDN